MEDSVRLFEQHQKTILANYSCIKRKPASLKRHQIIVYKNLIRHQSVYGATAKQLEFRTGIDGEYLKRRLNELHDLGWILRRGNIGPKRETIYVARNFEKVVYDIGGLNRQEYHIVYESELLKSIQDVPEGREYINPINCNLLYEYCCAFSEFRMNRFSVEDFARRMKLSAKRAYRVVWELTRSGWFAKDGDENKTPLYYANTPGFIIRFYDANFFDWKRGD